MKISTAEQVSFEWSHHRISSKHSKVKTTNYKIRVRRKNHAKEVSFSWSHHRTSSTQ